MTTNDPSAVTMYGSPVTTSVIGDSPTPGAPRVWIRYVAVALALVGWWLSNELLTLGRDQTAATPLLAAFCGPTATGAPNDCQSVLATKYARVGGLPVAAIGTAYFGCLALWFALVGPTTRSRWYWYFPLLLIVLAGAYESAGYVYVMAVVLERWCVGCTVVHAINAAILLLTLLAWPSTSRRNTAAWPAHSTAIASFVAMLCFTLATIAFAANATLGAVTAQYKSEYTKIVDDPAFARWHHERQPPAAEPLDSDAAFDGAADAPNTVVIFGDLQCTACRSAHDIIAKAMKKHPGRLKVIFRHFPLDRSCNEHSPNTRHVVGCKAARIVEAALAVGGPAAGNSLRDRMYAEQEALESRTPAEWAATAKLDAAKFDSAYASAETEQRIRRDIELGARVGVKVTPALFFNGRRLDYWAAESTWDALLTAPQP